MTDMTYYPPQLPGTRYVRTYRLMASWHRDYASRRAGQLKIAVYSDRRIAPYNNAVQGPGQTADMLRRNWRIYTYPIVTRWMTYDARIRAVFHNPAMFT